MRPVYENRSYLHIQFHDFEDTQLTLWVSYRYTKFDTRETKHRTVDDASLGLLANSQGKYDSLNGYSWMCR